VPGNHDYYTPDSYARDYFGEILAPYLAGDDAPGPGRFPFLRLRGEVAILGLCSAHPTPPLMAYGTLGPRQLERAEELLGGPACAGRFRLVALHHAPLCPPRRWHARLSDADALLATLRRSGAGLVIHGHLHRQLRAEIPTASGPAPVIGVGSGTWIKPPEPARMAQYNLYRIARGRLEDVKVRRYDAELQRFQADD